MSNPLDKLFSDKLAGHFQAPSPDAWKRIEDGFSKKNKGRIVFRMAAAILLVSAIAGVISWLSFRSSPATTVVAQTAKATPEPVEKLQVPAPAKKETGSLPILRKKKQGVAPARNEEQFRNGVLPPTEGVGQVEGPALELTTSMEISRSVVAEEVALIPDPEKSEKPIVIEYRLETIAARSTEPEAPPAVPAKEKTGFRKVVDFALDAKNSSPLGDLREAKEGLFAFNFKKEKQKNANAK